MRFLQEAIALEALCSTDPIEVTHKVATTCSLLLGATLDERKDIYRKAKKLYQKRSRIIHGAGERATIEDLKEMETIPRGVIHRILEGSNLEQYRTEKRQEEFLLDLWLGVRK